MSHHLILDVPEEVYEPLANAAQNTGSTPEAVAIAWLKAASDLAARDPVERFIGSIRSSIPDWADQHDPQAPGTGVR
jgi:hypothetical protein